MFSKWKSEYYVATLGIARRCANDMLERSSLARDLKLCCNHTIFATVIQMLGHTAARKGHLRGFFFLSSLQSRVFKPRISDLLSGAASGNSCSSPASIGSRSGDSESKSTNQSCQAGERLQAAWMRQSGTISQHITFEGLTFERYCLCQRHRI